MILVIGGAGYIGSHLVKWLMQRGALHLREASWWGKVRGKSEAGVPGSFAVGHRKLDGSGVSGMHAFVGSDLGSTSLHAFVASEDPARLREFLHSGRPVYGSSIIRGQESGRSNSKRCSSRSA